MGEVSVPLKPCNLCLLLLFFLASQAILPHWVLKASNYEQCRGIANVFRFYRSKVNDNVRVPNQFKHGTVKIPLP